MVTPKTPFKDYYQILGITDEDRVSPDFERILKAKYRKQAKKFHPDVTQESEEEANERFREINEANACLSDGLLRQQYDRIHEQHRTEMSRREAGLEIRRRDRPTGESVDDRFSRFYKDAGLDRANQMMEGIAKGVDETLIGKMAIEAGLTSVSELMKGFSGPSSLGLDAAIERARQEEVARKRPERPKKPQEPKEPKEGNLSVKPSTRL